MSDESSGPGFRGLVRGVFAEAQKETHKRLAQLIVAGAVLLLAALAFQVRGSVLIQGAIVGAVGTVLLWFVVRGFIGLWRYLRRKPPAPPVVDLAPLASTGRLAETHYICLPAFNYAQEYLQIEICHEARTGDKGMVSVLVEDTILRPFHNRSQLLEIRINSFSAKPPSPPEFQAILEQFNDVLNVAYVKVLIWIVKLGTSVHGPENLLTSDGYAQLYRRHSDLLQEIKRVKAWPGLAGLASWQQTLSEALPPPAIKRPEDPEPPTAPVQSPSPSPESSGSTGASK
jgi:hypothetical protein